MILLRRDELEVYGKHGIQLQNVADFRLPHDQRWFNILLSPMSSKQHSERDEMRHICVSAFLVQRNFELQYKKADVASSSNIVSTNFMRLKKQYQRYSPC
jgi:hypothetical protein